MDLSPTLGMLSGWYNQEHSRNILRHSWKVSLVYHQGGENLPDIIMDGSGNEGHHEGDHNCTILADVLQNVLRVELGFSFLLSIITIALIICHRTLRKQHHIISCHIGIADLLGIVILIAKDVVFTTNSSVVIFPISCLYSLAWIALYINLNNL